MLADGFGELAAQLGARELSIPGIRWRRCMRCWPHSRRVAAGLRQRTGPGGGAAVPAARGRGRVLITSQSAVWPPGQAVEVPVLDTEVAAGFLLTGPVMRTGRRPRELAGELGGLPLALEQAAAYMQASGRSMGGTWAVPAAAGGAAGPGGGGRVWQEGGHHLVAGLRRAAAVGPAAAGLLRLPACCAAEDIPLRPAAAAPARAASEFGARGGAVLRPLLNDAWRPGSGGGGAAAVFADQRGRGKGGVGAPAGPGDHPGPDARRTGGAWRQATAAVIEAAMPDDPEDSGGLASVRGAAAARPGRPGPDQRRHVADRAVPGQKRQLRRGPGSAPADRSTPGRRRLGAEHPDTLTARANLAYWTGEAGDAAGARDQFAALLPVRERVSGAEHPDTLTARAQPGPLDRGGGGCGRGPGPVRRAGARPRAGPGRRAPGHPDRPRQPRLLDREAGDAAGARDQFAALLPVRERVSGAEHPDTLTARATSPAGPGRRGIRPGPGTSSPRCCRSASGSSARSTPTPSPPAPTSPAGPGRRGMRPGPGTSSPRCCPCSERVLGAEHPRHPDRPRQTSPLDRARRGTRPRPGTSSPRCCRSASGSSARSTRPPCTARGNLAHWTGEAGDAAGARDQYAALLPVRERVLGPEHPDTLTARANLARWTGEAGDAAGARDQFAALLPVRERVCGPEHPRHPDRPRRPRPLDRGGGGCGRRPGPVRRAAARP